MVFALIWILTMCMWHFVLALTGINTTVSFWALAHLNYRQFNLFRLFWMVLHTLITFVIAVVIVTLTHI